MIASFVQAILLVVVVVVVVIGQTVGSISSSTLAYDCLCTLELCTAGVEKCIDLKEKSIENSHIILVYSQEHTYIQLHKNLIK